MLRISKSVSVDSMYFFLSAGFTTALRVSFLLRACKIARYSLSFCVFFSRAPPPPPPTYNLMKKNLLFFVGVPVCVWRVWVVSLLGVRGGAAMKRETQNDKEYL